MSTSKASLSAFRKLIHTQSQALDDLAKNIDQVTLKVMDMLIHLKGKAVICGMGKSGHIARKVAATLSSTGTPAVFMHPSESLHGDLGMVTKDDLVFLLSKSGENPELNLMAPSLKRMGVPIVAITFNKTSSLASLAKHVIHLGNVKEICPLELAPTTSATMTLVYMDALAMEVMRMKKFKTEEYALFHPGGQLGKRLLFKVKDLMIPFGKTPRIDLKTKAMDMLKKMTEAKMGLVVVCDSKKKLIGLITDNDIRRTLENEISIFDCKASDIMNKSPLTCNENENAFEVLVQMRQRNPPITSMPVVKSNGHFTGLIRLETLVQHGLI